MLGALMLPAALWAGGEADPLIAMLSVDKLEWRADADLALIEGEAWLGKDIDKLLLTFDAEREDGGDEHWQGELLYSRAISPYFQFLAGASLERAGGAQQGGLILSLRGTAPYFIEVEANLRARGNQRAVELVLGRELLLTQHLLLEPELELGAYSNRDEAFGRGQGLAEASFHLPLKYAFRRELMAYVALVWTREFGATAAMADAEGEGRQDVQLALGLSFWW